jgi:hypothetical protein
MPYYFLGARGPALSPERARLPNSGRKLKAARGTLIVLFSVADPRIPKRVRRGVFRRGGRAPMIPESGSTRGPIACTQAFADA